MLCGLYHHVDYKHDKYVAFIQMQWQRKVGNLGDGDKINGDGDTSF